MNFGSLAFGSFILAVIWIIRITFEIVDQAVKDQSGDNATIKIVMNIVRCCLDCFNRFIKFLNENAYIQLALLGENFCSSAQVAFVLALKNSTQFLITNGVGSLIYLLGKCTISISNTLIGYLLITNVKSLSEVIDDPIPILAIIFLQSMMMATIFMNVYDSVSLTIMQCLWADIDICNQNREDALDGSNRPKEMEQIVEILLKK
jgi:choline transporter-like protein 2/4/5